MNEEITTVQEIEGVNSTPERKRVAIDDGKIEVVIENLYHEEIGVLRFSPTDMNIINRYNEVSEKLDDVLRPLVDADITNTGEGKDAGSIRILNEVGDQVTELLDYIIDGDSRQAFFQKMHIFSIVNGHFYCENVFQVLGKFISSEFETEVNRVSIRVNQHTHGYRTGKHARGKT